MNNSLYDADLLTKIVTPFDEKQNIDFDGLTKLTNYLIEQGCNGFVVGSFTGERPTLSHDEQLNLYTKFSQIVAGRVPIIAETGTNSTAETIAFTNEVAQIKGIDFALVTIPVTTKANTHSQIAHFGLVAKKAEIPILIDNNPKIAGVKMNADTIVQLSHEANIKGISQSGSLEELEYLVDHKDQDFQIFTSDDQQALTARLLGANGIISIAAHLYCRSMQKMYNDLYEGDYVEAARIQRWLTPRNAALRLYSSAVSVKTILKAQGLISSVCRLPLVELNNEEKVELAQHLDLKDDAFSKELPLDLNQILKEQ